MGKSSPWTTGCPSASVWPSLEAGLSGSVLVNPQTGEITFLDVGMVGQQDLAQRANLIQLIFALQQQDVGAWAKSCAI